MAAPWYVPSGAPSTGAFAASAVMRSEFDSIGDAFNLLPTLSAGTASRAVVLASDGLSMTTTTGTLALAGNFATTGAFGLTLAVGAAVTLTLPVVSGTLATLAGTETLTNKTISGSSNTLSNIANASLTNSSITINGTSVSLGGSTTVTAAASSIIVGTTTVTSGTDTRVLYNNAGTLGEYTVSGTGSVAMTTSPVFTTPNLGTPSAVVLTSGTGLPVSTGISGLGANVATALAVAVGSAGAFVTFNGALGTPSSGVATNLTGTAAGLTAGTASAVAVGGITGLGTGVATFLATPSSANLAAAVTDETGSGALVFGTTPTLVTPVLGAATATSINGLTITSSTGVLTITNGKTLSVSNTLTFTGTDSSSVAFGAGGTVLYTASTIPLTVGSTTIASGTTGRVLYDNGGVLGEMTTTGSGTVLALATSPVLVTPTLGVAAATSVAVNGAVIGSDVLGTIGTVTVAGAASGNSTGTLRVKGGYSNSTGLLLSHNSATDASTILNSATGTLGIGANNSAALTFAATTNAVTISTATTLSAALTYGGVTLSNSVTGTGSMVLSTSPTFTGTVNAAAVTLSGALSAASVTGAMVATQSDQETATSTTTVVSPGRQQYHPSALKAWGRVSYNTGTPTLDAGYNVASLTDNGTGDYSANYTTAMSSASYAAVSRLVAPGLGTDDGYVYSTATGSVRVKVVLSNANSDQPSSFMCAGDL